MTLSDLASECETCGTRSPFTGKVKVEAGRRYVIVHCPSCNVDFPVFKASTAALVDAYLAGRDNLGDAAAFSAAWATLSGGDRAAVAKLLAAPTTERPLLGIEDVALNAESAEVWAQALLESRAWVPAPDDATRLEEALAVAIQYGSAAAAAAIAMRVGAWDSSAFVAAFIRLPGRVGNGDAAVIAPVLGAMLQRGEGWADAAKFAANRWVGTRLAAATRS